MSDTLNFVVNTVVDTVLCLLRNLMHQTLPFDAEVAEKFINAI